MKKERLQELAGIPLTEAVQGMDLHIKVSVDRLRDIINSGVLEGETPVTNEEIVKMKQYFEKVVQDTIMYQLFEPLNEEGDLSAHVFERLRGE